jgi:hypothetical protein
MENTNARSSYRRRVELEAFVIDELRLRRIDGFVLESWPGAKLSCTARGEANDVITVESVDKLLKHFETRHEQISELHLGYETSNDEQLEISFSRGGSISFSAYADSSKFQFISDGLTRELERCDAQFHTVVRYFAFSSGPRFILVPLSCLVSFFLASMIAYYFHARDVGVDVDPALIYSDNAYYQEVARAIKSGSYDEKLNTLLKGHLAHFENVSDVLERTKHRIAGSSIILVICIAALLALRSFSSAYPRAQFAIGFGVERLRRLERKREVWIVGVALAFAINLAAGFLLAFLP